MATWVNTAAWSAIRPPAKVRPSGPTTAAIPATTSAPTAAMVKVTLVRPWKAPQTSRSMADPARISSGNASAALEERFMAAPSQARRGALGDDTGVGGRVGQPEHHVGDDAEREGRDNQRREDHHLAPLQVGDRGQLRVADRAEDTLLVERQGIDRRQDHAGGGDGHGPGGGRVGPGHGQDLADEATGAW